MASHSRAASDSEISTFCSRNRAAISLYGKLGFEVCGRRRNYYRDTGEDALLMVCERLSEIDLDAHWSEWERRHGGRPDGD